MDMIQTLAQELNKDPRHVENVVRLLDEGNTIPFIARYRKELHGAMDDTSLRTLEERLQYLRGLEERRDTVKKSIEEQGKLTEELAAAIDSAQTLAEVEDLYRPYKQKRRTRATVAREKGLEPLAALLFAQERDCPRPEDAAAGFIDSEKGVETAADALQGANDIIAEWISDDAVIRKSLRELLERRGALRSLAATEEDSVYRLYYNFEQSLSRLQGHQILAINRGEKEEKLKVTVLLDRELALPLLRRLEPALCPQLLPVRTAAGGGLLLTVQCDWADIDGQRRPGVRIALTDAELGDGYTALWGGEGRKRHAHVASETAGPSGSAAETGRPLYRRQRYAAPAPDPGAGGGAAGAAERRGRPAGGH